MQAYAVVAHPDDCLIFAKCFIDNHNQFDWTIVYLTYNSKDSRAIEMSRYWNARSVKTLFLGFLDQYVDQETQKLNFWTKDQASEQVKNTVSNADLILTHNQKGEYGHIHHCTINEIMREIQVPKIYFSLNETYNKEYTTMNQITLDDFPIHKEVLSGFDLTKARYTVTQEAYEIIKNENINLR